MSRRGLLLLTASLASLLFVRPSGALSPPDQYDTFNQTTLLIKDVHTNLVWQRDVAPVPRTAADAKTYCESLSGGFRVPSYLELASLVDDNAAEISNGTRLVKYAIDVNAFPDTPAQSFWAADIDPSNNQWAINFADGTSSTRSRSDYSLVRCVRGGP